LNITNSFLQVNKHLSKKANFLLKKSIKGYDNDNDNYNQNKIENENEENNKNNRNSINKIYCKNCEIFIVITKFYFYFFF
jgi:uncharacterized membrane-anchored protein YhcB (DUF1043 family)